MITNYGHICFQYLFYTDSSSHLSNNSASVLLPKSHQWFLASRKGVPHIYHQSPCVHPVAHTTHWVQYLSQNFQSLCHYFQIQDTSKLWILRVPKQSWVPLKDGFHFCLTCRLCPFVTHALIPGQLCPVYCISSHEEFLPYLTFSSLTPGAQNPFKGSVREQRPNHHFVLQPKTGLFSSSYKMKDPMFHNKRIYHWMQTETDILVCMHWTWGGKGNVA